jgi:prolyl-tRNA synthetase
MSENKTKQETAINPTRGENYPEWYQQVVKAAELAEISPARGCMVIKPWGYALWENIQKVLDKRFKETGHQNAYFPLFIPLSFIEKEAAHVAGFAKECAVVTHHRLEDDGEGGLRPAGKLTEPYIVRPTSETIIGATYAKWVSSYQDLPILINQWANVVRWEMRPRLFLRTVEFLWQEGHTVHANKEEAVEETLKMLDVYRDFCEQYMAMPVIQGVKTESERFPGAEETYCVESMMQDGKALQAGTSHFLGQKFAKASEIKFLDRDGKEKYAWTTSWGVSTRLIGGLIMSHADDNGLVLPPKLAPKHVVIVPVIHKDDVKEKVMNYCEQLKTDLEKLSFEGVNIEVEIDKRHHLRGGEKTWSWIKKGVPVRLEIGPRDIDNDCVFMGRRDQGPKEKKSLSRKDFVEQLPALLIEMQNNLLERSKQHLKNNIRFIDTKEEFYEFFKNDDVSGFAYSHWAFDEEVEAKLKADLGVTVRCIPLAPLDTNEGICPFTGKKSKQRIFFAKSY